jgi:hypothetical protein
MPCLIWRLSRRSYCVVQEIVHNLAKSHITADTEQGHGCGCAFGTSVRAGARLDFGCDTIRPNEPNLTVAQCIFSNAITMLVSTAQASPVKHDTWRSRFNTNSTMSMRSCSWTWTSSTTPPRFTRLAAKLSATANKNAWTSIALLADSIWFDSQLGEVPHHRWYWRAEGVLWDECPESLERHHTLTLQSQLLGTSRYTEQPLLS